MEAADVEAVDDAPDEGRDKRVCDCSPWQRVAGGLVYRCSLLPLLSRQTKRDGGVVDFVGGTRFVCRVSALRNRLSVVFLVAIWFAATQHCGLESLGLFAEHSQDGATAGCCTGTDGSCSRDGCNTVESGSYKPDQDLKLAAPQFVACACQICLQSIVPPEPPDANVLRRDFDRSDPGAATWHFVQRAALPARAPSLSLA